MALAVLACAVLLAACGQPPDSSVPSAQIVPPSRPSASSAPQEEPAVDLFTKTIDFDALTEENADYTAWLVVPGTVIDYPVMYCADNSYYLNHDETKKVTQSGALFIDMVNQRDFSDPVTLIYGHYMPDESYFTQLHRYKDEAFFNENRDVLLYIPGGNIRYRVVAAFETDDRNLLYQKDYTQEATMQQLLDWIAEQRQLEANVDLDGVDAGDRLLVMSTCVQEVGGNGRLLVIAQRVEDGEDAA